MTYIAPKPPMGLPPSGSGPRLPPMGWSSWNRFDVTISEFLIKDIAEAMIESGMREAGYQYVNLDDGWMARLRDEEGNLRADPERFPSGIGSLARYLHDRGLKLGLYGDGGTMTCQRFAGNLDHEEQDARSFAEWEIDYFKEDWCYSEGLDKEERFTLMRDCLRRTGRPIVFSICTASFPGPWVQKVGDLWRTAGDIVNAWSSILRIIDINGELAQYAGPGHWNDPDMLEVGNGGLTEAESRTHFGLWCIMAAPLIAGNDLRDMPEEARSILLAPELIAVDQDPLGVQGTRVARDGSGEIWVKPLSDGSRAVALFNRGETEADITVRWPALGLASRQNTVRDLWKRQDLGSFKGEYTARVASHDTHMLRIFETIRTSDTAAHVPTRRVCENRIGPLSARTASPCLRWSCNWLDIARGQSAFQLVMTGDHGAHWDSGRRDSSEPWMRYDGPPLKVGAPYRWKVRVWDSSGQGSLYSTYERFAIDPEPAPKPIAPKGLRCDSARYPPVLSWSYGSKSPGDSQSAFRLLVSESRKELARGQGSLWDTGKRYSSSDSVLYSGKGLEAGVRYFWKLMCWNDARLASPYSEIGAFALDRAPGRNLLADPGFDAGGGAWHGVTHTDRRIGSEVTHSGSSDGSEGKSLYMKAHAKFERQTFQDVEIQGGRAYRAESWITTSRILTGGIVFTLEWFSSHVPKGADPRSRTLRADAVASVSGSSDWTLRAGTFVAPEEALVVRFRIHMLSGNTEGEAWIDDNMLLEAD